jgi:hypothetical protein
MTVRRIAVVLTCAGCMAVSSIAHAQSRSARTPRATVTWTIGGAGAGFGVGLWAGLSAFDDAINSERKVWTTAVVGAAVGTVGGYLIGRARAHSSGSSARRSHAGFPIVESRRSLGRDNVLPPVRSIRDLKARSSLTGGLHWPAPFPASSTLADAR